MTVKLEYARRTDDRAHLSWPRRIFPGLLVGVMTACLWIAQIGERLDDLLGNFVAWWVAPVVVLIAFAAIYARAHKPGVRWEALWTALVFSVGGLLVLGLLGMAFLYVAFLLHGPM